MAKSGNKKLRVGILGCGGIANAHAKAILQIPEYELAAFCDVDKSRAENFQKEYGKGQGEVFSDYTKMIEKSDLNMLTICLPPFAHEEGVELAARHGVNIMIEKPIALTLEKAKSMVDAVKKHKIHSQVGFMFRFLDVIERIKALTADGKGPGIQYTGRYLCNSLHSPWWRERSKSGGQMVEQAIHLIDLVRVHMGEPQTIYARTANLFHKTVPRYTGEDVSAILFGFDDGRIATLNATNAAVPGKWVKEWHLVAERAAGHFTDWNTGTITHTAGGVHSTTVAGTEDVFEAQLRDLIAAIREDRPAKVPMREGAASLRLALAARRSADERREIRL